MSERMIALADAADSGNCGPCCYGNKPNYEHDSAVVIPSEQYFDWYHDVAGDLRECLNTGIRTIVEREHPGLGGKPTSEWRR